jgi:hypothetical protein
MKNLELVMVSEAEPIFCLKNTLRSRQVGIPNDTHCIAELPLGGR